jgi:dTDP-4-amino-4,6-dideoxygalactose transaminase
MSAKLKHPYRPSPQESIVPAWPVYAQDEIDAVVDVLRSGQVNQWTGRRVMEFERAAGKAFGREYCVAVANGTVALELALRALGIGPGDEVIVSARSFVASATCVDLVGAVPVFADIDPDSQCITAATIAEKLTARTRAIIPVHLNGWPCEMAPIMELAERHDLRVIEDCAQSTGAAVDGRPAGSFGDAATFSFCQDKIITTGGEGGLVLFAQEPAYQFAWSYKDHGKSRSKMFRQDHSPGYRWVHDGAGTNWRMTELQAAIGLCQLTKLSRWLDIRLANARRMAAMLAAFPSVSVPWPRAGVLPAFYRLACRIRTNSLAAGWNRDRIMVRLNDAGVACSVGSCPEIYREGVYAERASDPCASARAVGETVIVFPVHPTMTERYFAHCERVIAETFTEATCPRGTEVNAAAL